MAMEQWKTFPVVNNMIEGSALEFQKSMGRHRGKRKWFLTFTINVVLDL